MSEGTTTSDELVFNGVDGDQGSYLFPSLKVEEVARIALGNPLGAAQANELQARHEGTLPSFGIAVDDPKNLAETGWGVIFPADGDPAPLKAALKELLDLRREQAGDRYKEYSGPEGYIAGESKIDWLSRHGVGFDTVDPDKVPYYLLLVGSPEQIPYDFQFDLDVAYATGRLHFTPLTADPEKSPQAAQREVLEQYAQYARSVVAAERGEVALPRKAAFFGTRNPDDKATTLSSTQLIAPLVDALGKHPNLQNWNIATSLEDAATKARLGQLLGGPETPSLLFTATHGEGFPIFDTKEQQERQLRLQGALVCQEWPGPEEWRGKPLKDDFFFAGEDVSASANLIGMIAFLFACYGAGTPLLDDFTYIKSGGNPQPITARPFVARLPQKLLGHPRGGALAVVGHVERATAYSFNWPGIEAQTKTFENALRRLMRGERLGWAMELFGNRYAEVGTELSRALEQVFRFKKNPDSLLLARVWTTNNDARSYTIIGDPAVRLPLGDTNESQRPVFDAVPTLTFATTSGDGTGAAIQDQTQPTGGAGDGGQAGGGGAPEVTIASGQQIAGPIRLRLDLTIPAGAATSAQAAAAGEEAVTFGILDRLTGGGDKQSEESEGLRKSLRDFAVQMGQKLQEFVVEAATLEVKTYVSDDVERAAESPANLRALTRIEFDGDTTVCVPQSEGAIDQGLWKIHTDMVRQAQTTRSEMMKAALEAVRGLLGVGG